MFDIAEYVESRLNRARRSGSDREMTADCPRCNKSSKFYVNTDTGNFVCFSCDFKGRSVVRLIAEVEEISTSAARALIFRRSVKMRRRVPEVDLRDRVASIRPYAARETVTPPEDVALPRTFRPVYRDGKWDLPVWLHRRRRIKSYTARTWGLGYCRVGRYAGRLVVPISCPNGNSFTARDMTDEQQPKYLNPTGADHRRLLIGWGLAPTAADLVLCEGPLDAIMLWQHNIPALALGGKELHDEQAELLDTFSSHAVTIMLDPEEHTAPYRLAEKLHARFDRIYIARLPNGMDPGDSTADAAHQAVDEATRWKGDRSERLASKLYELHQRR